MPKNELLGVIRSVHAGRRHIPPDVAARLAEHLGDDDLTAREMEVLRLIRDGYRNKQMRINCRSLRPRLTSHQEPGG